MNIGQVIYNLQDFHSSGGLISTSNLNTSTTISSESSEYLDQRLNIFEIDLVDKFTSKENGFLKVGIQAPPGTKVRLNGTLNADDGKIIMIGRTGVYELDEDVKITGMQFIKPKKYVIDTASTTTSLNEGISGFQNAEGIRQSSLEDLDAEYIDKDKDNDYWERYTQIQKAYNETYNAALTKYIAGINGIYVLPSTLDDTLNPEESDYEELYNVIVDFLYQ